jgi:signal transduction histidine kinase
LEWALFTVTCIFAGCLALALREHRQIMKRLNNAERIIGQLMVFHDKTKRQK